MKITFITGLVLCCFLCVISCVCLSRNLDLNLNKSKKKIKTCLKKDKPYIWVYWELINRKEPPAYIQLCIDTIIKNGSRYFNVVILDEKTVNNYVDLRTDINELPIALKTDYIRVKLLYEYGGLWIDADTVLMNNLEEVKLKLDDTDFIGFGCTGSVCKDLEGYGKPSNGVMGSVKNGRLIKRCLESLDKKLDRYKNKQNQFNYFDLGKYTIWEEYDRLMKEDSNYKIHHFRAWQDGTRDINGRWIAPNLIFKTDFVYREPDKLLLVMLANSFYCGKDKNYNWFCELSKDQILNGEYFLSKIFKKAFDYDPYY